MKFWRTHCWILVILLIGLVQRIYAINLPLLDAKPHREIHTAEETRNLYYDREIFYPKAKLWADEPGYYIVEFPLYNALVASVYALTGAVNELWGRVVSVLASVVVAVYFYLFVKKHFSKKVAIISLSFLYLISPQEIVMSRSFQPDQLGFAAAFIGNYYFSLWLDTRKKSHYATAFVAVSCMFLIKISFFPFIFPLLYLALSKYKLKAFSNKWLLFFTLTLVPFILWFLHMKYVYTQYPHLHSAELINPGSWLAFNKLTDLHWYVSIFYDFVEQITTVPVFLLAVMSFGLTSYKKNLLLYIWLGGLLLYALAFIGKLHFWHYQLPFIFPLVILAGQTINFYFESIKKTPRYIIFFSVAVFTLLILCTGRPYMLRSYKISERNKNVLMLAEKLKTIAKLDSKLIASSYNHAALTYYALRPDMWGATLDINEPGCLSKCSVEKFERLRQWGGKIYAVSDKTEFSQNKEFQQYLNTHYKILEETDEYIVYNVE